MAKDLQLGYETTPLDALRRLVKAVEDTKPHVMKLLSARVNLALREAEAVLRQFSEQLGETTDEPK